MAEAAAAKFEQQVSWWLGLVVKDQELPCLRSKGSSYCGEQARRQPLFVSQHTACCLHRVRFLHQLLHPPSSHQMAEIEAEHAALAKRKGGKKAAAQQEQHDDAVNGSTKAAAEETQQEGVSAAAEQQQHEGDGKSSEAKEKPQVG